MTASSFIRFPNVQASGRARGRGRGRGQKRGAAAWQQSGGRVPRIHARTALPGASPIVRNLLGKWPTQTAKCGTSRHVGDCRAACIQHSTQARAGAAAAGDDEPRSPNHPGGQPPQDQRGARGHIKLTSSWWPMSCGIVKPPYIQPCTRSHGRRPRSPRRKHGRAKASWRRPRVAFQVCLELALLPGSGRAQGSFKAGHEPP